MKLELAFSLHVIIFGLKLKILHAFTDCSIQNSTTNSMNGTISKTCFDISISILNEIIVHANQYNVVGLTFIFINDASASYGESNGNIQNYSIKLNNSGKIEIRGVAVGGGNGISSLKFLLFDPVSQNYTWTSQYGDNNSSLFYFNSDLLNTSFFQIQSISGCIDCNNSISDLYFDYSYNQCNIISTFLTTTPITTTGPLWNEWNPWNSCFLLRNRKVNDTLNKKIINETQKINVSCNLICKY
jgi:hypothetical protein